jgi:drug/metabolite transporter (DMT)-like permease
MVATLAAAILREAFTFQKRIGCALIVVGVTGIVWGAGGTVGPTQNIGHLLFLSAGLAWACYTVAMRRARLDGLHAAGLAATASLALYLPIYAYFAGTNVFKAPLPLGRAGTRLTVAVPGTTVVVDGSDRDAAVVDCMTVHW